MARMVNCVKLGRELPGLDTPPYPGELGQRIYENVSKAAWELWIDQSILIINHYGLSLADPSAQKLLMDQAEQFFFGEGARMPEGWSPAGSAAAAWRPAARWRATACPVQQRVRPQWRAARLAGNGDAPALERERAALAP